jgi:hypothetical protein
MKKPRPNSKQENNQLKSKSFRLAFLILHKTQTMFKILAKLNKLLLPSFTRQHLDLAKASKWQMAVIGWRYYVTTRALDIKK